MIRHPQFARLMVAGFVGLLSACSSGGGGDNTPEPTVQLTAQPTDVPAGGTSTLTWSSTNTDTCQASGGWSGTKFVSGSETVGPLSASATFTLQCTGRGGSATATATVTVQGGHTVAGLLLVPTTSRSDSDVNDPFAPFAANDTTTQAQVMPNPVVIGGYVNVPSAGPRGRSFAAGDLRDFYRVDLVAGQVIELVVPSAEPGGDDADLRLLDSGGTLVNTPAEGGQLEQLIVTTPGAYFILVEVAAGAPLYRLSVGQTGIVSSAGKLSLSDDFVPGELIVTLKDAALAVASATAADATLAARYGATRKGGAPDREMLLTLPSDTKTVSPGMTPGSSASATGAEGPTATPGGHPAAAARPWRFASAIQERKFNTLLHLERLRSDPDVRSADVNRVLRTSVVPNDPGYGIQRWHYEQIQLPGAWDVTTGTAIRVAVVDTGVVPHPELTSKVEPVDGYDFISVANPDGDGIDENPTDPGCGVSGGSIFHGTHVAGTIGAASNNGTGVAGVSWGARIIPIRALDGCTGEGEEMDAIQGIRYAAGLPNDSGRRIQPADVINLSFGSSGACGTIMEDLFLEVRAQGAVVVAAAGNDSTNAPQTPASCERVIGVAAVGPLRTRAPYSNFGRPMVDLAAPGGDMSRDVNGDGLLDGIYSTHATGGGAATVPTLELLQGTSMAAPHVAGVIALMLSRNATLTPAEIDAHLNNDALTDDIGPSGDDDLGNGLINARKAITVAAALPPLPPTLSVTPSSLAFGDIGTNADVVATNAGGGSLVISSVTTEVSTPQSWLLVTQASVDPDTGLGSYTVSVDRTGLEEEGSYSGIVRFTSNGGIEEVEVLMEVASVPGDPNAGEQYVLLLDPITGENLAQIQVLADDSEVQYQFDGVAAREYIVISGTDLNNDGFICDPAEACGAYPVESQPQTIVVAGDVTGLDFLVSYRTGVTINASSTGGAKVLRPKLRPRRVTK